MQQLERIDEHKLSRDNQVDYALMKHALDAGLWRTHRVAGVGVESAHLHGTGRRFDLRPDGSRLCTGRASGSTTLRSGWSSFRGFLKQVRGTLNVSRVPAVHAKTAVSQNRGVLKTLDNMVRPLLDDLSEEERERLDQCHRSCRTGNRRASALVGVRTAAECERRFPNRHRALRAKAGASHFTRRCRRQEIRELGGPTSARTSSSRCTRSPRNSIASSTR